MAVWLETNYKQRASHVDVKALPVEEVINEIRGVMTKITEYATPVAGPTLPLDMRFERGEVLKLQSKFREAMHDVTEYAAHFNNIAATNLFANFLG